MPSPLPANSHRTFAHSPVYEASRVMVLSICGRCGDSQVVSWHDGSLQHWEREHICTVKKPFLMRN